MHVSHYISLRHSVSASFALPSHLFLNGEEKKKSGEELRRDGGGRQGKGGCHIGATDDARAFVLKFSIGLFDLSDKIPANN